MRPIEKALVHATAAGAAVQEAARLLGLRILDGAPADIAGAARDLEQAALQAQPSLAATERLLARLHLRDLPAAARHLSRQGRTREADGALELSAVLRALDQEVSRANAVAHEISAGIEEVAGEIREQTGNGAGRILGKA